MTGHVAGIGHSVAAPTIFDVRAPRDERRAFRQLYRDTRVIADDDRRAIDALTGWQMRKYDVGSEVVASRAALGRPRAAAPAAGGARLDAARPARKDDPGGRRGPRPHHQEES